MAETEEKKLAVYERARLGGRVGFGERPAVVAVDIQKAFTDPESPSGGDLDEMVANAVKLIDVAKETNVPVIYTVVAYMPGMTDAGVWGLKCRALNEVLIGSKWAELDDRVKYEEGKDYFIVKKHWSAFFGTQLVSILAYHRVDTIIAVGDATSGCVRGTVQDGSAHGYKMIIPRECVGDRSESAHENSLFDMDQKLGDVVSMDEAINYLKRLK